jgi:NADH-quinone oxidoreductase subunit I
MPTIKLSRPKLDAGEKIYFGALIKGFFLTMTHAVKSLRGKSYGAEGLASSGLGVTMQFPEQRWDDHMPEYYRGAP